MKKFILFILAAIIVIFSASCSLGNDKDNAATDTAAETADTTTADTSSEETTSQSEIANPIVVVEDAAAIKEKTGADLNTPTDATEVVYSVIANTTGQIIFSYGDAQYTYRGAKDLSGTSLHGVYYEYDNSQTLESGGITVTAEGFSDEGTLATWTKDGINYSLFTTAKIDAAALQTVLDALLA
jgi:hypothetical protein